MNRLLGLAPIVARAKSSALLLTLNREGLTVLLVSQEVLHALSIAKSVYLLESGKITLSGPAEQLLADPRVKSSYLGL